MSDGMEVQIDISINDYQRGGGQLRLSERATIPNADFQTMADILAGFHVALGVVKAIQEAGR